MPHKIRKLPPLKRIKSLLAYTPDTGVFTWRQSRGTKKEGSVAGWQHSTGYWYIRLDGCDYKLHRLAWLYVYGKDPEGLLDHIDRNKSNNRITNLRTATHAQNQQNKKVYKNNRSGHKGIGWYAPTNKWRVRIQHEGTNRLLGYFIYLKDAVAARAAAEKKTHSHAAIL
jgi:hypothetical protein